MTPGTDYSDLATLVAAIARSPIVAVERARSPLVLPFGFDDVDVAILDWIAAEGRRAGRRFFSM